MTSTETIWVRAQRLQLITERGGHCQWDGCLTSTRLEFAHLKETSLNSRGRGSYARISDVRDNPEAYRLFCHTHHVQFDYERKHPTLEDQEG